MKFFCKTISIILIPIILSQGCVVYQKEPVTLDQATGSDKGEIKIITTDNKELHFDSLYYQDEVLYGLMYDYKNHLYSPVIINPESVAFVYLKNKKVSPQKPIKIIIIVLGSAYILYSIWFFSPLLELI